MKNKPVKLAALLSGIILLAILIFIQYFQQNNIAKLADEDEKKNSRDVMKEELLKVEPAEGEDAGDITVIYNVIEGKMEITIPNATENYDINKIEYGSPLVDKISIKNASGKIKLIVALKESCSYTKDIVGNKLYIHFAGLKENEAKVVVIDPGHGGRDAGAENQGVYEKNINLKIARQVKNILEGKGYIAVLTREGDVTTSVETRVDFVNDINPELFVSIHCNDSDALSATGTEVLYNVKDKSKRGSKWVSEILCSSVVREAGTDNRGIVEGNSIHIIRHSSVPVSLVEMGFIHSDKDFKLLNSQNGQSKFARGIANGIIKVLEKK